MDEEGRNVNVFDIGSQFIKYGIAEDYCPIYKFPSAVGRSKTKVKFGEIIDGLEVKELMLGDEAMHLSSVLDISNPVQNGIIENWDDMTLLWEYVYSSDKLKTNPKRTKIFLTESPLNTLSHREKTTEIMFEKFGFHSIAFGNQAALSIFSSGLTSGVVVNFYDTVTDIAPVNIFPIDKLAKRVSSSDNPKIAETIFEVIQAADQKVQNELFKRIILLGDSAPEAKAVEEKIKQLYLENILQNDAERMKKVKIRVDKFPSDNDCSFKGGALLGQLNKDKSEFWISKENYNEIGMKVLS